MNGETRQASEASSLRPLQGVRVLDLTRLIPGNYATLVMATLGADVVKVEDGGLGDYTRDTGTMVEGQSAIHHVINRGKRSVALNLKTPEGRADFEALVRTSHVLLESFRPGTLAKLGYPAERLHELRPDLVICSISGFGSTGPLAHEPVHDLNLMAWSGLLDRLRLTEGGEPIVPPIALVDLLAGMCCVMFTIPYIRHAERTGKGVVLETPMAEALAMLPTVAAAEILAGQTIAPGGAYKIADGRPGYNIYRTRDGYMAVGAYEDHFFKGVLTIAGAGDLIERRNDASAQEDVRALLSGYFGARTNAEIIAAAGASAACLTPVQSYEDMLVSEHAAQRAYVQRENFDPMPVLALPVTIDGQRPTADRGAPRQGQHNSEILHRDGAKH